MEADVIKAVIAMTAMVNACSLCVHVLMAMNTVRLFNDVKVRSYLKHCVLSFYIFNIQI